jgi:hypothetical protein
LFGLNCIPAVLLPESGCRASRAGATASRAHKY